MDKNYRSSKAVLKAAKQIIPNQDSSMDNIVVNEGLFELKGFLDEKSEALWVIEKIQELLKLKQHSDIEGDIYWEKMAILARNKYVFKILENELRNSKIPFCYKMTQGAVKFESDLMKLFDLALRIKLNPLDILHKDRLCHSLGIHSVEKGCTLEREDSV
ncbi:MAG: 3'-5' exonuclease [Thiotrichaceae bacterium]|nr:3'-5' exonuclease [Thiotrichaceae bacterium]